LRDLLGWKFAEEMRDDNDYLYFNNDVESVGAMLKLRLVYFSQWIAILELEVKLGGK
jgi:hypothetical protein